MTVGTDAFRLGEAGGVITTPLRPLRRGESGGGGILGGDEMDGLAGPGPPPAIEASSGVIGGDCTTTGFEIDMIGVLEKMAVIGIWEVNIRKSDERS